MPETKAEKNIEAVGEAAGQSWEALITANEALDACKATNSASLYRHALDLTIRRAEAFLPALKEWREALGE